MELKDIVCDLDLAKKLNEFGVKQDSAFYFDNEKTLWNEYAVKNLDVKNIMSAFTSDELLEMLPDFLKNFDAQLTVIYKLTYRKFCKDHKISYINYGDYGSLIEYEDKKLPNALAKIVIWLIENNYVNVNRGDD